MPTDACVEYCQRALLTAGLLLAADSPGGADLKLARLLLRESWNAALGALAGEPGLDATRRARVSGVLQSDAAPRLHDLREVERDIAELVDRIGAQPRSHRARARRRAVVFALFVAAVAAVVSASLLTGTRWERYRWHASSAAWGFTHSGTLGQHGFADLVFHTAMEKEPWVVIDMLERRAIDRIVVGNRRDCCYERALPLVVEVGEDEKSFATVGEQKSIFETWVVTFSARQARFIRIRSRAFTTLHLREIRVP